MDEMRRAVIAQHLFGVAIACRARPRFEISAEIARMGNDRASEGKPFAFILGKGRIDIAAPRDKRSREAPRVECRFGGAGGDVEVGQ